MLLKTINLYLEYLLGPKRMGQSGWSSSSKDLMNFVGCKHSKKESIENVLELIRPRVHMVSIDLKDAFYSVPVHKNYQAYLTFLAQEYLQFAYMPNGYETAMPIFTNILKIQFSILRGKRFLICCLRWWLIVVRRFLWGLLHWSEHNINS